LRQFASLVELPYVIPNAAYLKSVQRVDLIWLMVNFYYSMHKKKRSVRDFDNLRAYVESWGPPEICMSKSHSLNVAIYLV
jgi:hypothetical protein